MATPAQTKAIEEVRKLLKLHFDSFLLVTRSSNENGSDSFNVDWTCAITEALGLAKLGTMRVEEIISACPKTERSSDDSDAG